jgi:hypothetical protein
MADRYWVGGSGTWDNSSTTKWSTSSGGAGGASAPTFNDYVIFDSNSGTGTVTLQIPGGGFVQVSGLRKTTSNITFALGSFMQGIQAYASPNTTNGRVLDVADNINILNIGTYLVNCFYAAGGTYSIYCTFTHSNVVLSISGPDTSPPATINLISSINFLAVSNSNVIFQSNNYSITSSSNLNIGGGGAFESSSVSSSLCQSTSGLVAFRKAVGSPQIQAATGIGLYLGTNISGTATLNSGYMELATGGGSGATYSGTATLGGTSNFNCGSTSALSGTINFTGSNQTATIAPNTGGTLNFQGIGPYTLTGGGRVSTLSLQNNRTYTLTSGFGANTINANGTTPGGMSITGAGGIRTLTASSSFSLSNITWANITAAGTIPFTGTGFVDGGGNTNIQFVLPQYAGLFFGSNF